MSEFWTVDDCSDDDDKDIEEMQKEVESLVSQIQAKKLRRDSKNVPALPLQFQIKVEIEEFDEPQKAQEPITAEPNKSNKFMQLKQTTQSEQETKSVQPIKSTLNELQNTKSDPKIVQTKNLTPITLHASKLTPITIQSSKLTPIKLKIAKPPKSIQKVKSIPKLEQTNKVEPKLLQIIRPVNKSIQAIKLMAKSEPTKLKPPTKSELKINSEPITKKEQTSTSELSNEKQNAKSSRRKSNHISKTYEPSIKHEDGATESYIKEVDIETQATQVTSNTPVKTTVQKVPMQTKNESDKNEEADTLESENIPQKMVNDVRPNSLTSYVRTHLTDDYGYEHFEAPTINASNLKTYSRKTQKTENVNSDAKSDAVVENVKIKEEIEENDVDYEEGMLLADVKEETEEYYEDDIIILNSNYSEVIGEVSDDVDGKSEGVELEESDGEYKPKAKRYTCNRCNFTGTHRKFQQHRRWDCHKGAVRVRNDRIMEGIVEFKCSKCSVVYSSLNKYLKHLTRHDYKSFSCPECLAEFTAYSELVRHLYGHIKSLYISVRTIDMATQGTKFCKYQCKMCQRKVRSSQFFVHWEKHLQFKDLKFRGESNWEDSAPEEPYLKEMIALLLGLDYESLTFEDKRLRYCKKCKRKFKRQYECKRHFIEHLLDHAFLRLGYHKGLKCQICESVYDTSLSYKSHMRLHASLPVYKCDICDKSFSDSSNFAKHKKVHNLDVLTCEICQKKFSLKMCLVKHMQTHINQEPMVCEEPGCGRVFRCRTALKKHHRSAHTLSRYKCNICKDSFPSLKYKWDHQWEEHKVRFQIADCPVCKKSFRKLHDVKAHYRAEHGVLENLRDFKLDVGFTPAKVD